MTSVRVRPPGAMSKSSQPSSPERGSSSPTRVSFEARGRDGDRNRDRDRERGRSRDRSNDRDSDNDDNNPSGETKGNGSPDKKSRRPGSGTINAIMSRISGGDSFRDSKELLRLSRNKAEVLEDVGDHEEDAVEMCAGWAMIPIVAALRDTVRKKKIEMYGGTPFSLVQINKKEVPKRPGDPPFTLHISTPPP